MLKAKRMKRLEIEKKNYNMYKVLFCAFKWCEASFGNAYIVD